MSDLATLLAKDAIRDVIFQYCEGVDRENWDLVRACFTADCQHDHGTLAGDNDTFIAVAAQVIAGMDGTLHHIGNTMIDVAGNSATSQSSFVAYHRVPAVRTPDFPLDMPPGEVDWIVAGRYIDRWVKTAENWRIQHRKAVHDWTRTEAAPPRPKPY